MPGSRHRSRWRQGAPRPPPRAGCGTSPVAQDGSPGQPRDPGAGATAGPNRSAAAKDRRSAVSIGPMMRAAAWSPSRSTLSPLAVPSRATRNVSALGRAAVIAKAPAAQYTAAAPAAMADCARIGASPPGACTMTSTGMSATRTAVSTRVASWPGDRCPPPSDTHSAAAPGRDASARASRSQRVSVTSGAGPATSVGTNPTRASRAAAATASSELASLSGSSARMRPTPASAADRTNWRTTSGPTGRSCHSIVPCTTMPTGVRPTWRTTARMRSQGDSVRSSSAARAQRGSMTSMACAPTWARAPAAAARSLASIDDPHGKVARSRSVVSI